MTIATTEGVIIAVTRHIDATAPSPAGPDWPTDWSPELRRAVEAGKISPRRAQQIASQQQD